MPMPLQARVVGQQLKEPQNAFGLFLADKNEDLANELRKDTTDPAVEQLAADRWRALSPAERGPWQKKAAALHFQYQAYQAEQTKVKSTVSEGGKKKVASPRKARPAPKIVQTTSSNATGMAPLAEAAKKIKRPQSSYFLWFNASRPKIAAAIGGNPSLGSIAKKGAEMWKTVTEEEKAPFEEQAKAAKEEFDKFKESDEGKEALKMKQRLMKEKRAAKQAKMNRRAKRANFNGTRKEPLKVKNMLPKKRNPSRNPKKSW